MKKWDMLLDKSAGHYVVTRNGSIYSCVPEDYWSTHLGLSKHFNDYDRRSISVFLVNELYLVKENGKHYAFGIVKPHNLYTGPVFEKCSPPRTIETEKTDQKPYAVIKPAYHDWADYDDPQLTAAAALLEDICARNRIPTTMFRETDKFEPDAWKEAGIISHANCNRSVYDFPMSPAFIEKINASKIKFV